MTKLIQTEVKGSKLKIDYFSDTHIDFYVSSNPNKNKIQKLIKSLYISSSGAKICVIAGDIGHYNKSNVEFLKILKEINNYDYILITFGNHEFYNVSNSQEHRYINLYDKVNEFKEMVNPLENIYFLDGNCVTLNGVKFGGAGGWYDSSYYHKLSLGLYSETMVSHWCNYTNDSNFIPGLNDPMVLFKIEIEKIKKVINEHPDIMITHFCPVSEGISFDGKYKTDRGSGYYCFDGLRLFSPLDNPKPPKIWIHGHIHSSKEFKIYDTLHVRNPVGYPGENKNFEIKHLEI